jgi:hypothetical protein
MVQLPCVKLGLVYKFNDTLGYGVVVVVVVGSAVVVVVVGSAVVVVVVGSAVVVVVVGEEAGVLTYTKLLPPVITYRE